MQPFTNLHSHLNLLPSHTWQETTHRSTTQVWKHNCNQHPLAAPH